MSEDAACAECFLCALFAKVVKPISDLPLLISGLCALLIRRGAAADEDSAHRLSCPKEHSHRQHS
jgi:hypothetical protein